MLNHPYQLDGWSRQKICSLFFHYCVTTIDGASHCREVFFFLIVSYQYFVGSALCMRPCMVGFVVVPVNQVERATTIVGIGPTGREFLSLTVFLYN